MKKYQVWLVAEAERDLFDIYQYVAAHDSVGKADRLLQKLEATCSRLDRFPHRGRIPPELARVGLFDYREVFYKPYRIFYQVEAKHVYIHCVLDGRRDMQILLQQRLLR